MKTHQAHVQTEFAHVCCVRNSDVICLVVIHNSHAAILSVGFKFLVDCDLRPVHDLTVNFVDSALPSKTFGHHHV